MNSTDEYLDSLLRAAMESDDNDSMGPAEAYREDMLTGVDSPEEDKVGQKEENSVFDSMSSDSNEVLSSEEIEAMFAALENTTTEAAGSDEAKKNDETGSGLEDEAFLAELESLAFGTDETMEELENLTFGSEDEISNLEVHEREADENDLFSEANFLDMDNEGTMDLSTKVNAETEEDLLESLTIDDDELAEINELLKQSDHGEMIEDDMLAMLEKASSEHESSEAEEEDSFDFFKESEEENFGETEEKEAVGEKEMEAVVEPKKAKKKEKKKKWFFGKKKKEKELEQIAAEEEQEMTLIEEQREATVSEALLEKPIGETEQEMLDLLGQFSSENSGFEDDFFSQFGDSEDLLLPMGEEKEALGKESGESEPKQAKGFWGRLFDLLTEEEEEEIKEKPKKEKKKKGKKAQNENEEIINELEEEDENAEKKKKKKAKKVKKEKKEKKQTTEDFSEKDEKKLPKKMVIRIFTLCLSLLLLIVLISNGLLALVSLKQARSAFYDKDYASVYENMLGTDLNESDSIIFEKATLVLRLERKYDSYVNYMNMGNRVYALHALLSGLQLYQELYEEAVSQKITEEFDLVKTLMVDALDETFGISEQKAFEIIAIEDAGEYQKTLEEISNSSHTEIESEVVE